MSRIDFVPFNEFQSLYYLFNLRFEFIFLKKIVLLCLLTNVFIKNKKLCRLIIRV
jgi:hypothetical protein